MFLFFIFTIGLSVGSFLNVLADRLPRGESVINGRSHCDKCKKELAWFDLIPLLSFVFLRGKCRYCRAGLSYYYPVVELTTGALFVLTFIFFGGSITVINIITFIYYLYLGSSLIVVFFADLKYGIIPDKVIFPAILISFLYIFIIHNPASPAGGSLFVIHLLSALGTSLFFLLLLLITKGRGMGFGDVKFAFLMGLVLGFPSIIVGFYAAFLTGAVVGIILIIWRKKRLRGASIPFGPFLVLGTLLGVFAGEVIFQKITSLLLSSTTF